MPNVLREVDEGAVVEALRSGRTRLSVCKEFRIGDLRVREIADRAGLPRPPQGQRMTTKPPDPELERTGRRAELLAAHRAFALGAPPAAVQGRPRWPRPHKRGAG